MRSIVSSLTDESSSELLEELMKSQPLLDEAAQSDNEDEDWEKWMPDPVDADPGICIYTVFLIRICNHTPFCTY